MQQQKADILIIGAGPVGLFTAFQAGMMDMSCIVVDILSEIGGQCTALYPEKPIYDIPAYPEITAAELVLQLQKQATPFSPNYILGEQVLEYNKLDDGGFVCSTNKGSSIHCKAIIIAAGGGAFGPNRPPLDTIEQYEDSSVLYYVKDRNKFSGKEVVIAGGGDSAVDWALSLSEIAAKVTLVHRREKFRCSPHSSSKLKSAAQNGQLTLAIPFQLHSLQGDGNSLQSVSVIDLDGNTQTIKADYLLPFFGLSMELGPLHNWQLELKQNHIAVALENYSTNIEGIYAVGDVASYPGKLKLIMTGFAESATAIHHAYTVVHNGKLPHFQHSTDKIMPKL